MHLIRKRTHNNCFNIKLDNRKRNYKQLVIYQAHKYSKETVSKQRTFSIEDFKDNDYVEMEKILKSLQELHNFIKAKIANILWTEKKDYKSALIAASCYKDYFEQNLTRGNWKEPLEAIRRAIYIYAKLNKKDKKNECCQLAYDCLLKYSNDYSDYFPIELIQTL